MNRQDRLSLRIMQLVIGVIELLLMCTAPVCSGSSFMGLIPRWFAGHQALVGVLSVILVAGVAASAVAWLVKALSDRTAAALTVIAHIAVVLFTGLLAWVSVGSGASLAETLGEEETAAIAFGNYLIMMMSGIALALTMAIRIERVAKRDDIPKANAMLIRIAAIVLAVVVSMLMILIIGYDPVAVFYQIYLGSIGTTTALKITLERAIPLLLVTLSAIISFRMKFWNVGTGGQLTMGAIFASFFAYNYAGQMPHFLLITLMFIAAAIGGALWALLPTIAKIKWGTSETLFALMLNYVATYIIQFLRRGPWEDPMMPSFGQCAMFTDNARLSLIFGVSSGWIVALITLVLVTIYLQHTKHGFEITVVGEQSKTAQYVGIDVKRVILRTMLISGAIAGMAGMLKICGADFKLNETIAGDVGFRAITIAWLSKLNPLIGAIIAVIFGALNKGCESLSMSTTLRVNGVSIPSASATVIIGIILLFVLGCEFFISYRLVFRKQIKNGGVKE